MSKIMDIMAAPWYITQHHLAEMQKAYDNYLKSPQTALEAFEKNLAGFLTDAPERGFTIINNDIAIIEISGILTPELGIFSFIFGGTSTEAIQLAVNEAADDQAIKRIILLIDTPGGVVYGTQETAETIFAARSKKPIIALVKGKMLSAGTYIGSAAHKVFASGDLVDIGHIGVRTTHTDLSEMEHSLGIKVTDLSVGDFKTLGTPHKPLSREDEQQIMSSLLYSYDIFTRDVAKYRGLAQQAIMDMGARVFQGKQAIDVGLADGIATFDDLINKTTGSQSVKRLSSTNPDLHGGNRMDLTTLKAEHQDTYLAAVKIGEEAGIAKGKELAQKDIDVKVLAAKTDGLTEGAANEAQRIKDVQAQSMPGSEKLIAELIADGKTTGPEAAVKVLEAQKANTAAAGKAFDADGKLINAAAATDNDDELEAGKDFMSLVKTYRAENKCSQGDAIKAMANEHPDSHDKFIAALKNPKK